MNRGGEIGTLGLLVIKGTPCCSRPNANGNRKSGATTNRDRAMTHAPLSPARGSSPTRTAAKRDGISPRNPIISSPKSPSPSCPPNVAAEDSYFLDPQEGLARLIQMRQRMMRAIMAQLDKSFEAEEMRWQDLEVIRRIGVGAFAEVLLGKWKHRHVAVKRFLLVEKENGGGLSEEDVQDFRKEVAVMSKLQHENIVQYLGACTAPPNLSLVMCYCPKGCLSAHLKDGTFPRDVQSIVRTALGIAKGMQYLHSLDPKVVHRDLKCENVYLMEDWSPCIGDFGLSIDKVSTKPMTECGTFPFMAPEVLRNEPADERLDVYGFAMTLYELLMCRVPYSEMDLPAMLAALRSAYHGLRPDLEGCQYPDLAQLARDCWQDNPALRPSFDIIVHRLEAMLTPIVEAMTNTAEERSQTQAS